MEEALNNYEQLTNANMALPSGYLFSLGDFSIIMDEDSRELRVSLIHPSKHIQVRPKSDNSILLLACR